MKNRLPQAESKLLVQFKKWFEAEEIRLRILKLRKALELPDNGIELMSEDVEHLGDMEWVPKKMCFDDVREKDHFSFKCNLSIHYVMRTFVLSNDYLEHVLRCYIFYNRLLFKEIRDHFPSYCLSSLCQIVDAKKELEEIITFYNARDEFAKYDSTHGQDISTPSSLYVDFQRERNNTFPAVVRIHPEASQRDVIDFIKSNWSYIKKIQNEYKKPNQMLRHSKTKLNEPLALRNKKIYELRDLPRKKIAKMLVKDRIFLDVGTIGKIISDEKKKREKK